MNGVDSIKFSSEYIAGNASPPRVGKCAQDSIEGSNETNEKRNDTHAPSATDADADAAAVTNDEASAAPPSTADGNCTGKSSTLSDVEDAVVTDATAGTNDNDTSSLTNESSECQVKMKKKNKNDSSVDIKEEEEIESGKVNSVDAQECPVTGRGKKNDKKLVNQCEKDNVSPPTQGESENQSKRKNTHEINDETGDSCDGKNLTQEKNVALESGEDENTNRHVKKFKSEGIHDDAQDVKIADESVHDQRKMETINLDDESKAMKISNDKVTTDETVDGINGKDCSNEDKIIATDDGDNSSSVTYWAKLQASLTPNLPRDLQSHNGQREASQVQQQAIAHFWAFLRGLLVR